MAATASPASTSVVSSAIAVLHSPTWRYFCYSNWHFCLLRAHSFGNGATKSFAECSALFSAGYTLIVLLITCVPVSPFPCHFPVSTSLCVLLLHKFPVGLLLSWLTRRWSHFFFVRVRFPETNSFVVRAEILGYIQQFYLLRCLFKHAKCNSKLNIRLFGHERMISA